MIYYSTFNPFLLQTPSTPSLSKHHPKSSHPPNTAHSPNPSNPIPHAIPKPLPSPSAKPLHPPNYTPEPSHPPLKASHPARKSPLDHDLDSETIEVPTVKKSNSNQLILKGDFVTKIRIWCNLRASSRISLYSPKIASRQSHLNLFCENLLQ